ncbi:TPA: hypothetical protein ACX6PG_000043 [Photobacterium damselae]
MADVAQIKQENSNLSSEELYKKAQRARLAKYLIGEKDGMGYTINKVYARGDEYVIYEAKELSDIESLKVVIDTEIENNREPIDNFSKVKDKFDKLKSVMYKSGMDASYKQRAASALVTGIMGNIDESKNLFKAIEDDALEEYKNKIYGRLFYLLGALVLTMFFVAISLGVYFFRYEDFIKDNIHFAHVMYGITFACFGGLFSVSLKAKEVYAQRAIGYWMFAVYGAERLIISIISGIAAYTLVSSGLLFSVFQNNSSSIFSLLTLCFVSGFSETLIPNSLNKLEKSSSK